MFNDLINDYPIQFFSVLTVLISTIVSFGTSTVRDIIKLKIRGEKDKEIEAIKNGFKKQEILINGISNTITSVSASTVEKKMQCYEKIWDEILKLRMKFPTLAFFAFEMLDRNEFYDIRKFAKGDLISSYSSAGYFDFITKIENDIEQVRPFIEPRIWELFFAYRAIHGRLLNLLDEVLKGNDKQYWLDDENFVDDVIIKIIGKDIFDKLTSSEFLAFRNIKNYIEMEIIGIINSQMTGDNIKDNILKYALDLSTAMNADQGTK